MRARRLPVDDDEPDLALRLDELDVAVARPVPLPERRRKRPRQKRVLALRLVARWGSAVLAQVLHISVHGPGLGAHVRGSKEVLVVEVDGEGEVFDRGLPVGPEQLELLLAGDVEQLIVGAFVGEVGDVDERLLQVARHVGVHGVEHGVEVFEPGRFVRGLAEADPARGQESVPRAEEPRQEPGRDSLEQIQPHDVDDCACWSRRRLRQRAARAVWFRRRIKHHGEPPRAIRRRATGEGRSASRKAAEDPTVLFAICPETTQLERATDAH
jgi:hypothetical protein